MDHAEATRIQASTRYLQGELTISEAQAFEEHFFSCTGCAQDVTLENAFIENLRAVFRDQPELGSPRLNVAPSPGPSWWSRQTAWVMPLAASAALLAVVVFQNVVTIPRLKTEVAQISTGEAPFSFPLKIARGTEAIAIPDHSPLFMPYFYPPGSAAFARYVCEIQTPSGLLKKRVVLPAPPSGQPLSMLLRRADFPDGTYTVTVRGDNAPQKLGSYTVILNSHP